MIRQAETRDLDAVEQGYTDLLTHEAETGSNSNWVLGVYPTRQTAADALARGELFVLEEDGEICASIILNQAQAAEYQQIPWEIPAADSEILVIHTLCIPPAKAGRGYGKRMARFALDHARHQGCRVIRLDTWAENKPAATLYQKLGFRLAGRAAVLHEGVIPEELIFFERDLSPAE